jgi:translation initiation factor IF-3
MVTLINQNARCNDQIRISPVRLIGENNEQIGVIPTAEALRMAREAGLDLVEVAANVRPPVCRLMNYGRWKYTQKKNQKKHHELSLKEVRLRPKTDAHDRLIKVNRAIKFLKQGHKVQFTMVFRGREHSHREIGHKTFRSIAEEFGERVKVERLPSMEGRRMVMILAPVKGAFDDVEIQSPELEETEPAEQQQQEETAVQPTTDVQQTSEATTQAQV